MKIDTKLKPQLKKSLCAVKLNKDSIIFAFTKKDSIIYNLDTDLQREIIIRLDGNNSIKEIYNILREKSIDCSIDDVMKEIEKLYDLYLLEFNADYNEDRYSRQEIFWGIHSKDGYKFSRESENKIRNTSVTLLGLGGFGSHILYSLVYAGIGKIKCIDFDKVTASNLNRQILYKEEDIGKFKTDAALENITKINKNIEYQFINRKIESKYDISELILGSDIAILAADSPRDKIFQWANEASYETKVPLLFSLGFSPHFVRIGPLFIPGNTVCFSCSIPHFKHDNDNIVSFINDRNKQGSIIPYLSIATGIMMLEFFKHVTGFQKCMLYNGRINFNLIDYKCQIEHFKPNKGCIYCKN